MTVIFNLVNRCSEWLWRHYLILRIFLVIPRASQRKSKEETEITIYESEVEESEEVYRPLKNREMVKFHFPKMGLKKKKKVRVSEGEGLI